MPTSVVDSGDALAVEDEAGDLGAGHHAEVGPAPVGTKETFRSTPAEPVIRGLLEITYRNVQSRA